MTERENEQLQKIDQQQVKLTNQNKLYFPKDQVTKGDVIDFYQNISKYILPYLKNLSLIHI